MRETLRTAPLPVGASLLAITRFAGHAGVEGKPGIASKLAPTGLVLCLIVIVNNGWRCGRA
ncbi:hypothetical protein D3C76_1201550 [compost metagenome]